MRVERRGAMLQLRHAWFSTPCPEELQLLSNAEVPRQNGEQIGEADDGERAEKSAKQYRGFQTVSKYNQCERQRGEQGGLEPCVPGVFVQKVEVCARRHLRNPPFRASVRQLDFRSAFRDILSVNLISAQFFKPDSSEITVR
jgi:hypothetical protein